MRIFFYFISFLLLASCGQNNPKVKNETPVAQIEFPEGTEYDFGTYFEKEVKTHAFLVRNSGNVPLVISQLKPSCICTQATAPQKPILGGQTDTIFVTYDGDGFLEGFWSKRVTIHANIENGTRDLCIRGTYYEKRD